MELYNIRDLKFHTSQVIPYPGNLNKFRLQSKFADTSIQDSKYIFLIYSGKQRFIELGYNHTGVYKILRTIMRVDKSINGLIIKAHEVLNGFNKQ